MNIILSGLRGTGKTKIGRLLAKKIDRPFIDLDQEIEKITGTKITNIVKKHGWEHFRTLEKKITRRCAKLKNHVIATGGGTLIDPENTKLLKKNGIIILLTCDLDILKNRMRKNENRPTLTKNSDFLNEMEIVWKIRKPLYENAANFIINTSKNDIAETIKKCITCIKPTFSSSDPALQD